jgi:putative ABC transport system permease protein
MGYTREHLVYIPLAGDFEKDYDILKEELKKSSNVLGVTASFGNPTNIRSSPGPPDWEGRNPEEEIYFNAEFVDYDYFDTFQMKIIQGRSFSKEFSTDMEKAYIVNEEAVRQMGMKDSLGKGFAFWGNWGTIIGVVNDFHFQPIHNRINPVVFKMDRGWLSTMYIRIKPDNISGTIAFLEETWEKTVPNTPFQCSFLDEVFNRLYRAEDRMGKVVNYFTILAIFIACLGLFGLASFMADKRTKEIGIRKVLGASVSSLVLLLSKEFTKWVLLANLFAWPAAYFIMHKWLQNFAYRTEIEIWIFLLTGVTALAVAVVTVSYQAIRTALANPLNSLRYE